MKTQKSIEAVAEITSVEGDPPWPVIPLTDFSFLRLHSEATLEEIGTIVLAACLYGRDEESVEMTPNALLALLMTENLVLPGGVRFSQDGAVKVIPGCCSGVEDWREWFNVLAGEAIWTGHSPTPTVELVKDDLRIWKDSDVEGSEFIDFRVEELRLHLHQVEADLIDFGRSVGKWKDAVVPTFEKDLVSYFLRGMDLEE